MGNIKNNKLKKNDPKMKRNHCYRNDPFQIFSSLKSQTNERNEKKI